MVGPQSGDVNITIAEGLPETVPAALKTFSLASPVLMGFDSIQHQLDHLRSEMEKFKTICQSVESILKGHQPPTGRDRRQGFKEIWEVLEERRD